MKEETIVEKESYTFTHNINYDCLLDLLGPTIDGQTLIDIINGGPSRVTWIISYIENHGYQFINS